MKKYIFILAALFAVSSAQAQITLEHTFEKIAILPNSTQSNHGIKALGDIAVIEKYHNSSHSYDVYDLNTYLLIGSFYYENFYYQGIFARSYFTSNDDVVVLGAIEDKNTTDDTQRLHLYLFYLDGTILQDLGTCGVFHPHDAGFNIIRLSNGDCKMALDVDSKTRIYSLPGNGETTDISSPSSLERSVRKIKRDGQVLVETENNIYSIVGQTVR